MLVHTVRNAEKRRLVIYIFIYLFGKTAQSNAITDDTGISFSE